MIVSYHGVGVQSDAAQGYGRCKVVIAKAKATEAISEAQNGIASAKDAGLAVTDDGL